MRHRDDKVGGFRCGEAPCYCDSVPGEWLSRLSNGAKREPEALPRVRDCVLGMYLIMLISIYQHLIASIPSVFLLLLQVKPGLGRTLESRRSLPSIDSGFRWNCGAYGKSFLAINDCAKKKKEKWLKKSKKGNHKRRKEEVMLEAPTSTRNNAHRTCPRYRRRKQSTGQKMTGVKHEATDDDEFTLY